MPRSEMLENGEIEQIAFAFDELLILVLFVGDCLNLFEFQFRLKQVGVLVVGFVEYAGFA